MIFLTARDELGGDISNLVRVNESTVAFYLFSVSGHGIAAALAAFAVSEAIRPLSLISRYRGALAREASVGDEG